MIKPESDIIFDSYMKKNSKNYSVTYYYKNIFDTVSENKYHIYIHEKKFKRLDLYFLRNASIQKIASLDLTTFDIEILRTAIDFKVQPVEEELNIFFKEFIIKHEELF